MNGRNMVTNIHIYFLVRRSGMRFLIKHQLVASKWKGSE